AGCDVTVAGKHPTKLDILRSVGVAATLVDDLPPGKWDVVVDCTGSPAGFALAVARARPRGTVVLKSTVADRSAIDLAPIVIDEITVVGSRCGPFAPAIRALADGQVDVRPLIAATVPLADAVAAFALAAQADTLKVLLRP
ncbi:MAG: zinc-binding dehydrogenase, partial [Dehalococcoidia bacterium]|nr:zinc-binding dehydrogenase [Dehalococcoidia bacterium]